jgi:hypothetical protein
MTLASIDDAQPPLPDFFLGVLLLLVVGVMTGGATRTTGLTRRVVILVGEERLLELKPDMMIVVKERKSW